VRHGSRCVRTGGYPATTARSLTGANSNNSALHSVSIGVLRESLESGCCTTTFADSPPRCTQLCEISGLIGFRHFHSALLALASLNLACRNLVPTFPQRSLPLLLTTAACGGLRSTPDCRPQRTYLDLSYSYATPFGPASLVTQCHKRPFALQELPGGSGLF
jgi:hypothetical protein